MNVQKVDRYSGDRGSELNRWVKVTYKVDELLDGIQRKIRNSEAIVDVSNVPKRESTLVLRQYLVF